MNTNLTNNEKRISRIAFNTNWWIKPSGPIGKSISLESYEQQLGFAHEEWLFDLTKLVEGYHYGFLESIRKFHQTYVGSVFDVWLFTIDNRDKRRYWVGEIKNLEVISTYARDQIFEEYERRGWYDEIQSQIKAVGAGIPKRDTMQEELFNIRFKPEDVTFNNLALVLSPDHRVYKLARYMLYHF